MIPESYERLADRMPPPLRFQITALHSSPTATERTAMTLRQKYDQLQQKLDAVLISTFELEAKQHWRIQELERKIKSQKREKEN